ncbi:hypothetical protein BDP27DRAFT_514136 [Rhodocollybia butyracea]|uniref:Uncharacterized protein n=1 Tax=Rhodocollybia butyracea TaxID=206335 RepID=A0A9P5P5J5_9AGAR|nr:hypothetical protein BDP27DRAFT_514136 [Rhodocollybia butyracea]
MGFDNPFGFGGPPPFFGGDHLFFGGLPPDPALFNGGPPPNVEALMSGMLLNNMGSIELTEFQEPVWTISVVGDTGQLGLVGKSLRIFSSTTGTDLYWTMDSSTSPGRIFLQPYNKSDADAQTWILEGNFGIALAWMAVLVQFKSKKQIKIADHLKCSSSMLYLV